MQDKHRESEDSTIDQESLEALNKKIMEKSNLAKILTKFYEGITRH